MREVFLNRQKLTVEADAMKQMLSNTVEADAIKHGNSEPDE
jgi:hypothetical protein